MVNRNNIAEGKFLRLCRDLLAKVEKLPPQDDSLVSPIYSVYLSMEELNIIFGSPGYPEIANLRVLAARSLLLINKRSDIEFSLGEDRRIGRKVESFQFIFNHATLTKKYLIRALGELSKPKIG